MSEVQLKDSSPSLVIKAGPAALKRIQEEGFSPDLFTHVAAAAGGPKWLALNRLDRAIFGDWLLNPPKPLIGIGSSIGAWRLACLAQEDPIRAIERFEAAYLAQSYSEKPSAAEVAIEAGRILDAFLCPQAEAEILNSQRLKINFVTTLCRGTLGVEHSVIQMLGLIKIVAANSVSRKLFARCVQRVVFHAAEGAACYSDDGFRTAYVELNSNNLKASLLGTAAIPLVIASVKNIPGGPLGTYRDGGLVDYHMDLPLAEPKGLTLLPHFSEQVVPGWFDRSFTSRQPQNLDHTVLLAPSEAMLARLPHGKVPDRKDFALYGLDNAARIQGWNTVLSETQRMADDWQTWQSNGQLASVVQPL